MNDIEKKFVMNFIDKQKKERFLYELNSPKKREQAIKQLLFHIERKLILFEGTKIRNDEMKVLISKYFDIKSDVYLITDNSSDDGKIDSFENIYNKAIIGCFSYIILCGENLVYIKNEIDYGAPYKLLLYKKPILKQ